MDLARKLSRGNVRVISIAVLVAAASPLGTEMVRGGPIVTPIKFTTLSGGNVGENWTGPVQFEGIVNGEFNAIGVVDLGSFTLGALPARTTLGIDDLPFSIQLWVWKPGDPTTGKDASLIEIQGRVDGVMKGSTQSSLVASVTSISSPSTSPPLPFDLSSFQVHMPQVLRPNSEGVTRVYGFLSVPEPTAMATLLVGAGLLALRHRGRSRARRSD